MRGSKKVHVEITLESGDRIALSDKDIEHAKQAQASAESGKTVRKTTKA